MIEKNTKSKFIIIDGPSASGKDTLIKLLKQEFIVRNIPVFVLSEDKLDPNRDEIKTWKALDQSLHGGSGDRGMALALVNHRQKIYKSELLPRLKQGINVLANRGLPATMAYQTLREVSLFDVWKMHNSHRIKLPNLIVITNCSVNTAENREKSRVVTSVGLSGSVTHESGASQDEVHRRRQAIHQNYHHVADFLREHYLTVLELDTDHLAPEQEIDLVLRCL